MADNKFFLVLVRSTALNSQSESVALVMQNLIYSELSRVISGTLRLSSSTLSSYYPRLINVQSQKILNIYDQVEIYEFEDVPSLISFCDQSNWLPTSLKSRVDAIYSELQNLKDRS